MTLEITNVPVPLRTDPHGVVRVGTSRVALESVLASFFRGDTPEDICQQFPTLELADIYAVITFYLYHQSEVQSYLEEQTQAVEVARQEIEARWPSAGIRERLLARRSAPR